MRGVATDAFAWVVLASSAAYLLNLFMFHQVLIFAISVSGVAVGSIGFGLMCRRLVR
jgi:hypothetical protein